MIDVPSIAPDARPTTSKRSSIEADPRIECDLNRSMRPFPRGARRPSGQTTPGGHVGMFESMRTDAPAGDELPIERYALIGDAGTAALVSDAGSIDWLCLPRFDSDPVFGALLDPRGGRFSIRPAGPFETSRWYLDDTAVLVTEYRTPSGTAELTDLFAAREGSAKHRRLWPFRYLVRRLAGVSGTVEFHVELRPADAFGRRAVRLATAGCRASATVGGRSLLAEASERWRVEGGALRTTVRVATGERRYVTASFAGRDLGVWPASAPFAEAAFEETVSYWRRWAARAAGSTEAALRSAITLKLLTFAPSGAVVAAPTTSLPEDLGGVRNWDYRFSWVRDASWTIAALTDLGYAEEARAYMSWVTNAARLTRPYVNALYSLHGRVREDEREVSGLRGYAGSRPVRTGNAAAGQLQLDNWGHVVDAAYQHVRRLGPLGPEGWPAVRSFVEFAAENWRRPDQGMWEARGAPEHHVHSKVMCWVALDRGLRFVRDLGYRGAAERWEHERDAIRDEVLRHGVHPTRGCFVRVFGADHVDASLLLIAQTGFVPADDDRMLATIDAVQADLCTGDLVYRYRADDGVGGGEGPFLACSFWLAHALALAGRRDEARAVFDAAAGRANDVGLLPEEIDPGTGRFLGNFPQGLSHIALLNAASALGLAAKPDRPG